MHVKIMEIKTKTTNQTIKEKKKPRKQNTANKTEIQKRKNTVNKKEVTKTIQKRKKVFISSHSF